MNLIQILSILCGFLNMFLAILHGYIIYIGASAYDYFGAGDKMVELAKRGSKIPALVTSFIVIIFLLFSAYSFLFSNLLTIELPYKKVVIQLISALFLFRGSIIIFQIVPLKIFRIFGTSRKEKIFSFVSVILGLLHLPLGLS